jgi:hypothetical protein
MRIPLPEKANVKDITLQSDPDILKAIGEVIYKAASGDASFDQHAADQLIAAGVHPDAFKGKTVNVVRDTEHVVNIVVPKEVKGQKDKNDRYLQELGAITIMGCR